MGLARSRPPLRADGDVPARVPLRRRRLRRPRRDPRLAGRAAGAPGLAGGRRCCSSRCCCRSCPGRSATSTCSDRVVPISTGSGKALYVGTYLPADGEYQRVKAILVRSATKAATCRRTPQALNEVDPTPLFDRGRRSAIPDLPRDSALGKIGKENFSKYFGEDPLGYAGDDRAQGRPDVVQRRRRSDEQRRRAGRSRSCSSRSGWPASSCSGLRRRWWELVALATPIVLVTAVGAASLAAPRRNEVLMTLVFPLAALALSRRVAAISSGREWSPRAGIFPAELTALRSGGLLIGDRPDRRLRGRPPALAAQRRRADPARSPGSGWRSSPAPKSSTACSPPSPSKRATAAASSASPSSPSSSSSC